MTRAGNILFGLIICAILLTTLVPLNLIAEDGDNSSRGSPRAGSSRGLPNDMWPGFHGGSAKTGNTTAPGLGRYNLLWSKNPGVVWNSASVAYDKIYVTHGSGITCYDLNGTVVWSSSRGNNYASPLIFNGRVYIVGSTGSLASFNANSTGSNVVPVWTYTPSGVSGSASSPVTDGNKIYYSTKHTSGLHAVWLSNGTKAWNATLGGSTVTEASPSVWNGKVYCGGGGSWVTGPVHDLFCFNATNGDLIWKFTAGDDVCTTPAIEYDRVYFGSLDGKIYSVDAEGNSVTKTTTKYWEYSVGSQDIYASVAVGYGRVYIGDSGNVLRCLDAFGSGGSTTQYWSQTFSPSSLYGICSSAAITPQYIFVGNSDGTLHCRSRATGAEIWKETYTGDTYGISSSPAIYKDYVIATSDNGYVYLIGPDKIPPKVESSDPIDSEIDVDPYQNISVKFDEDMNLSSLSGTTVTLKDSQNNDVTGTISADMNIETIFFTPTTSLLKNETFNFTVTTGVTDTWENGLDGNGNGVAEGVGVDEFQISFTTVPFYPPTFSSVPLLKPTEDIPFMRNLSAYINDADSNKYTLIITEDSDYATLDGFELNLLYPEGVLNDEINMTASDGMFTVDRTISVQVKAVNDPPVISEISDLELTEDIMYSLDMKNYIVDVDTSLNALAMYDSTLSKYIDIDGLLINFTYPEGITEDTINVTVWDTTDDTLYDYTEISVIVSPVNDAPNIAELPGVNVKEDIEYEFSLEEYIFDVDTAKENLIITVESQYVTVVGHKLFLTYPEKVSSDILEIKVYDGEFYDNETLFVFLEPVNDPPIILSLISPEEGKEFEYNESFDCVALVSDEDLSFGDELSFLWYSHKAGELATTQNATGIKLGSGYHLVSFTVTDKAGARASRNINITVKAKPEDPKPKPNITDPEPQDPTDDDKEPDEKDSGLSPILLMGIIGIIIVIVILVLVFMLLKRKKKSADEEVPATGEGTMPIPEGGVQPPGMPMQMQFPDQMEQQQFMSPEQQQQMQLQMGGYDTGQPMMMEPTTQTMPMEQEYVGAGEQPQQLQPMMQDALPPATFDQSLDQSEQSFSVEGEESTISPSDQEQFEETPTGPQFDQTLPMETPPEMNIQQPEQQLQPEQQQQQVPMYPPMQPQPNQPQGQGFAQIRACSLCGDMMVFNPSTNSYFCNICHNVEY
jgi:outer membrane protein assembly factor BamB